jgi:hypothetical protein
VFLSVVCRPLVDEVQKALADRAALRSARRKGVVVDGLDKACECALTVATAAGIDWLLEPRLQGDFAVAVPPLPRAGAVFVLAMSATGRSMVLVETSDPSSHSALSLPCS